jgi:hypothetical protein
MIKTCKNQHIIDVVMKSDYWRAVWINRICYFRTFEDNVIYHGGLHIENSNDVFNRFDNPNQISETNLGNIETE